MSDMQRPQRTDSGISVGGPNQSADYGLNATVNLSRKGMGPSSRVASSQAPSATQVNQLPRAVATETSVTCPADGCKAEFEIDPSLYGEVGQCEQCSTVFYIEPPGSTRAPQPPPPAQPPNSQRQPVPDPMTTVEMSRGGRPGRNTNPAPPPPKPPAAPQRTTSSGIQAEKQSSAKDYGLTATVTLSRSGMGMMQKKKAEMPAPNQMRFSVARGNEVACPQCRTMFPITPEVYGAIAECSECACEFQIRAPSGAGAAPPAQAPAPAPTQAPAPQQPAQPAPSANAPAPSKPRPSGGRNPRKGRRRTRSSTRNKTAAVDVEAPGKGGGNAMVVVLVVVIVVLVAVIVIGGFLLLNK